MQATQMVRAFLTSEPMANTGTNLQHSPTRVTTSAHVKPWSCHGAESKAQKKTILQNMDNVAKSISIENEVYIHVNTIETQNGKRVPIEANSRTTSSNFRSPVKEYVCHLQRRRKTIVIYTIFF